MYQIGIDAAPPILSAELKVTVGSLQEVMLTVPRSYYDSLTSEPEFIYAAGYGGHVESVAFTANQVAIAAKSRAGSNAVDYTRLNPSDPAYAADTVSGWLTNLAASGNGSANFSGDNVILGSSPLIAGLAAGEFFSTLRQLAGCYGLDVIHLAKAGGDIYKFAHAAVNASETLNKVLSLSFQGSKPSYDYAGITKTAPITQRDTAANSAEHNASSRVKYTSQGHPYLEPEATDIEYIGYRGVNGWQRPGFDQISSWFDKQLKLGDEENQTDTTYQEAFIYAPYFGSLLVNERNYQNTYSLETYQYSNGSTFTISPGDPLPDNPQHLSYSLIRTENYSYQSQNSKWYYYGVWPANVPWGTWNYLQTDSHTYLDKPPTTRRDEYSGILEDDIEDYSDRPYAFRRDVRQDEEDEATTTNYFNLSGDYGSSEVHISHYENKQNITLNPGLQDYPWLPIARDIVSSRYIANGSNRSQEVYVSKALFSGNFNFANRPATIDPDPPADIDIETHSESWFDPTAMPAGNYQFMGLGCVANIKYKQAISYENVLLLTEPAGVAATITARWANGSKIRRYNVVDWDIPEVPDGSDGVVFYTMLSSASRSFSTLDGTETGEGYIVTGTVWSSKAIALACVPYILRQQNRSVQVAFNVPLVLSAIDDMVALVGATVLLFGKAVYITGVVCDFNAEVAMFSGCLVVI